jgi:ribose transport system substrate-binding protein
MRPLSGGGKPSKALIALLLGVLLAALVAGCGSSGGSSSSSETTATESTEAEPAGGESTEGESAEGGSTEGFVKEAEEAVEAARKVPTKFEPPGPAFDVSGLEGKTVYVIAAAVSVPFIAELDEGISDGLEKAGVKTVVVDGQVNPARVTQFLEQAVAQKADLVINQTLPSSAVEGPMKKVKAAGIPVVQMFEEDPGPVTPEAEARGVVAGVSECSACAGKLQAQWAIADSGGEVKGVGIEMSAVEYGDIQREAIKEGLAPCSSCSVDFVDTVSALEWATKVPTLTATTLRDKSVNYLFPFYDNEVTSMIPAINAANASDQVTIVTYNGNANILAEVQAGRVGVDLGESAVWLGWAGADQALRVLKGVAPTTKSTVPLRAFDETNIDSIDLSEPASTWYGVDFEKGFEELWGVS